MKKIHIGVIIAGVVGFFSAVTMAPAAVETIKFWASQADFEKHIDGFNIHKSKDKIFETEVAGSLKGLVKQIRMNGLQDQLSRLKNDRRILVIKQRSSPNDEQLKQDIMDLNNQIGLISRLIVESLQQ